MKNFKFTMLIALVLGLFTTFNANAQLQHNFSVYLYKNGAFLAGFAGMTFNDPNLKNVNYGQIVNMRDYDAATGGNLNDKANNAMISADAGTTITFYKNADADYSRGQCIVYVKQSFVGYRLTSLEHTYEDAYIRVVFYSEGRNSLNGELSSIVVTAPPITWGR
ncbi:hypothetical protein H7F33_10160 [Pedobacter sp. PAMC26386]|nr:hypothetical protein H7F33_10160 [Pedobacter sp. PAMC26386]